MDEIMFHVNRRVQLKSQQQGLKRGQKRLFGLKKTRTANLSLKDVGLGDTSLPSDRPHLHGPIKMSTDDSISEDVSSSGALSHCHVSGDGNGGKESEASLVSSEGTSASGPAVSEDRLTVSQITGGTVENRPMDFTPACNKIRSLCLSTEEVFEHGRNLPFINPSSLETLRALVQEIQSSGETDPEIWKDCEGRWLHLFQLVEKQYQEQILAQQEQYQCQIQLIQDEIKALVQLQNRQANVQPNTDFSPTPLMKSSLDPLLSTDSHSASRKVSRDHEVVAAAAQPLFNSPSPPFHTSETTHHGDEGAVTLLSSGYGTLSTLEMCVRPPGSQGKDQGGCQVRDEQHWPSTSQEEPDSAVGEGQQDLYNERTVGVEQLNSSVHQQTGTSTRQPLTSWAQRQKLGPKKNKTGRDSSETPEYQKQLYILREHHRQNNAPEHTDSQDQHRSPGQPSNCVPLRRSDSLMSEASGLTYWRLNENELYRPLPDSFDSSTFLLLQEAARSFTPTQEHQLSLYDIYRTKHKADCKRSDWEGSLTSSPSSPQMSTLDPAVYMRQSDHTSGFTSPSHFSSPSFAAQPQLNPRVGTSLTPDSMVESLPNPGDTDYISDTSSLSVAAPSPSKGQSLWADTNQVDLSTSWDKTHSTYQHHKASAALASEEDGSYTRTVKSVSAPGANLQPAPSRRTARASALEDPVVLSLLRQKLREKHSRHVADLKAYYESEIQSLREKLHLPQDLEKCNQAMTQRCKELEKALAEANGRIQELEAKNCSLEKKLAEWPERYNVAGATVKSLQQRLEESKRCGKEKDAMMARLKSRVRQLEEVLQKASREADERETRKEREHKMLQALLKEYDSLIQEHEATKNKLVSVENKLVDANDNISELKRGISKLETQLKQLEHENQARARYASSNSTQASGAGLFHHPDLLLSPSKSNMEPETTCRKSPGPLLEQMNGSRKSPFSISNTQQKSPRPGPDPSSRLGCSLDSCSVAGSWRCASPPECEQSVPQNRHQEQSQRTETSRTTGSCTLTPTMRALIELEETRATESRAPWFVSPRTTVGVIERRNKEPLQELRTERDLVQPGAAGRSVSVLRPQRSLSPEGHRSSSMPPGLRNGPTTTPTKRETLLTPLSAKSSPKRCPSENYSTAFGHMMPRAEHLSNKTSSCSTRKKLQFTSADREDEIPLPDPCASGNCDGNSQLGWEKTGPRGGSDTHDDLGPLVLDNLHSLAEAEKLFDELTQEKLHIEAALSRIPVAGPRVNLQTRLNEVALENRLEKLNRRLGSIRMILKRFHILPSSANS